MAQVTLEQRVESLEYDVAELKASWKQVNRKKDWRRTIGMFTGDEVMKQIDREALKYREADRRKARRRGGKSRRVKA
jgi:hypothetical protein